MFARFHFSAAREREDQWHQTCNTPMYPEQFEPPFSGRNFDLECCAHPDFARGNYGSHSFTHVGITLWSIDRHPLAQDLDTECDAGHVLWDGKLLLRGRGQITPYTRSNERYLITTCQIEEKQFAVFLDQFVAARSYLVRQPGFIRHHLFKSRYTRNAIQFINIAIWRSMSDFSTAFSNPNFKKLISGGFDHTSQIIIARRATRPRPGYNQISNSRRAAL